MTSFLRIYGGEYLTLTSIRLFIHLNDLYCKKRSERTRKNGTSNQNRRGFYCRQNKVQMIIPLRITLSKLRKLNFQ